MAAYVKYNSFVDELAKGNHGNLSTPAVFKVALSNTAGDVAQTLNTLSQVTQISGTSTGYTTGGSTATMAYGYGTGTVTLTGTKVVFTCATNPMGPLRYAVIYNDTHATDGLIGSWDYASSPTLAVGETFSVKFNSSDTTGNILTLT